jgi:ribosomal protein S18 acetylase RimI-like enzyme
MTGYRGAEACDAEAIALLHARSWRESYRGEFSDEFLDGDLPAERLAVWRERLAAPARNPFIQLAFDGPELVGFVCAYGDHDPRWGSLIDNLHVVSDFKRAGIGSSLMSLAGTWLAQRYADLGVYLLVLESNSSARRFYENLGARNASVSTMETHGGAMVRSCHYTWARPGLIAAPS